MDSSEAEEIALLSVILFDNKSRRKQAKKRRCWIREIFQRREEHGVFSNLVTELQRVLFQVRAYTTQINILRNISGKIS